MLTTCRSILMTYCDNDEDTVAVLLVEKHKHIDNITIIHNFNGVYEKLLKTRRNTSTQMIRQNHIDVYDESVLSIYCSTNII